MKRKFTIAPALYSKICLLLAIQLLSATLLQAQRGIPVPVPPGGTHLFPDWVVYLFLGIIVLVIVVNFMDWFISCFRDFRSFSTLLVLAGIIAATWIFWKATGWGFGWCLLAGYSCGLLIEWILSFLQKQVAKRN